MERKQGWQVLEEAVRGARPEEAARKRFEAARVRMYTMGVIDMMRTIAAVLPGTTLTVTEDFGQAGGRGFPPSVTLEMPKRSIDPRTTIEVDTLVVHPVVFEDSKFRVVVWSERTKRHRDEPNQLTTSRHMRWDCDTDNSSLPGDILEGVKQLGLPNINLTAVKKALGHTLKHS